MPPVTRSQLRPQQENSPSKPCRPPPEDRHKSSRTRALWRDRKQNYLTDPLFSLGQQFARTGDPFVSLKTMVKRETRALGRLRKRSETWRQGMHLREERREHRAYLTLQQLLRLQEEDLSQSTATVQNHILNLVAAGQAKAWSTDLAKAKALLFQRLGDDFDGKGFEDDTIGRLLCPITHKWRSEEVRRALREAPQTVVAGAWPKVLYQSIETESQRPWEGFLRNSLLVMTYKHIFRDTVGTLLEPYKGLSLITITYIATLVVAALSSDSGAYTPGSNKRLFNLLSGYLYEHRETNEAKDLVRWWDRQLGNRYVERVQTAPTGPTILEKLQQARLNKSL
ncbi:hypothetical protein BKA70DRAFT_1436099 [Coprinopsis sp. MPI-PUGE-AT-0042]|nr:hypothetical protein BKA70DRAFT_1444708 [Coprinopsis sp. MPI-PUGE-AT-0042]KAH6901417.1 hypothetical protein BKA70DRAFT_1436099 [Coprinopsis sp. MPI-PUGE-AT-0042]